MHFKKLEIIGFKSFVDKTTLLFEPGITAIVGPNGCGKSNIFDAVRWVLGEQSIKSLRGSKMEDVIFNGTEKRPALNIAEVSLSFFNKTRLLPIDYDEVTITRRIFRSGESEYLLNKTQVRLKDVTELLLGTGIGAEAYSLVEQGKIDLILSSRPEDRRLVFDEAAGVTKYKSKKKEALRRLEDTENNLIRVNDIVAEVKRQINSLDRQVNKAKRYKEQFEKLKDLEVKISKLQIKELKVEFDNLFKRIEILRKDETDKNNKLLDLNTQIHNLRSDIQSTESRINKQKDEEYALMNILDRNTEFIKMNQERIKDLELRINTLDKQSRHVGQRIISNQEKFDSLNSEFSDLSQSEQKKDRVLKENEATLGQLTNEIKNNREIITKAKKETLLIAQGATTLRNELSDLNGRLSSLTSRKKRLTIEREKVSAEKQSFDEQIASIQNDINMLNTKLSSFKKDESGFKYNLENSQKNVKTLEDSRNDLKNQKLGLESQIEFLEKLKLKYEDIHEVLDGVIIVDKLPSGDLSGILSRVKEIKKTEDGRYRISCELKPIPLDTHKIKEKIDKITAEIQDLKLKIDSEKDNIAKIESDLSEIAKVIHQQYLNINSKKTNLEGLVEQMEKLTQELEIVELEYSETELELNNLTHKEREFKVDIAELEDKRKNNEAAISDSQDKINVKTSLKEEISVSIARITTEINSLDDRRITFSNSIKLMQETLKSDMQSQGQIVQEIQASRQKIDDLGNQNNILDKDISEAKVKKDDITTSLNDLRKRLDEELKDQQVKEESVTLAHKEIDEIKNLIYELSMQDKEIGFKESAIKERILQSYKVNLDEVTDPEEVIDTPPLDVLGPSLKGMGKAYPLGSGGSIPVDKQVVLAEIEHLKIKIEKMGTVNLVAIEEHEELKQRFEFLTNQQNDLISAKESLKSAISKINKTTKQMFLDTFNKVSQEFRVYFRLLFGGGDAQLILVDEVDVLESGIEIIARPPGKKLQNVSLLSGGEKSLSGIALIFAVFKVKPSPFCVLDEIDAALDESNIGRFNRLLQEFITTSQFLIITHNKKTITAANVMYGITMQEEGISKIVSAKLKPVSQADKDEKKTSPSRPTREKVTR